MTTSKKKVRYPQNLPLKQAVKDSGFKISGLAKRIGYCSLTVSQTINGHYLGTKVVPLLRKELGLDETPS